MGNKTNTSYDVIIVGTGAGGGTLLHRLASSGKKILVIERGGYLPREAQNWSSKSVFGQGRYKAHEEWLDKDGKVFHPGIHYYVGGNTKVYGSALLRFRENDFAELKHHGGISPAWPLTYKDYAPYYTEAEKLYHVHGRRGADPTEAHEDEPYAHDALVHEPRIQELSDELSRLGYKPFPLPLGVKRNEKDPQKSLCIKCGTCDGFPCLVDAKSDSQVICVDPSLAHSNVTLLTHSLVTKLETDASGRKVTKVHVTRDGLSEEYSADVIVLSCGAVNTAALLLKSANEKHPRGLANSSDVVGRHYMCHNNSAMLAITKKKNETTFEKTLGLNDFYFKSDDWDFPLGHIQMLGKSDFEMLKGDAPPFAPNFVLKFMAEHSVDFWMTTEDLPDPDNRVTVGANGQVTLKYVANNLEAHRRLVKKLKKIFGQVKKQDKWFFGDIFLAKQIPLEGTAHQCGTVRFGHDPKTSALDTNCKAHDLDNLYVVDGSFFVSSSSVNPGLTIMANALRVGDHLLERMK